MDSDSEGEGHPPTPPSHPRQDNLADTHDVNAFYAKLNKLQLKKRTAAQRAHKKATKRTAQQNPTSVTNPPKRRTAPGGKRAAQETPTPGGKNPKKPAPNKPAENRVDNPTLTSNNPTQRKRTQEDPTAKATKKSRTFITIPWTPERAQALKQLYRTVNLEDMDVCGDGNCFLYAALGINGHGADHPQAAATLRRQAIAHARSLPMTVQNFLELRRPAEHPTDPYGNMDTTCKWSMDHQEEEKAWINSNMFYSIATVLRIDIAITHHLTRGANVCQTLILHRAGPHPSIPHPADLLPQEKSCQWAPPPPPGTRRLHQYSLITLLNNPRQTSTEVIPIRVIHTDIGSHFRATKPLTLDQQPPKT